MSRASAVNWIMISKITLVLLLISIFSAKAQTLTSSNLPIVIISTDINPKTSQPYLIVDNPRVLASMKIIKRPDGSRNFYGRISIEIRGSSSQGLPKKPYGLTTLEADNVTNNNVSLLGMPKENDWILNSLAVLWGV